MELVSDFLFDCISAFLAVIIVSLWKCFVKVESSLSLSDAYSVGEYVWELT